MQIGTLKLDVPLLLADLWPESQICPFGSFAENLAAV